MTPFLHRKIYGSRRYHGGPLCFIERLVYVGPRHKTPPKIFRVSRPVFPKINSLHKLQNRYRRRFRRRLKDARSAAPVCYGTRAVLMKERRKPHPV